MLISFRSFPGPSSHVDKTSTSTNESDNDDVRPLLWIGPELGFEPQMNINGRDQGLHSQLGLAFGHETKHWGLMGEVTNQNDADGSGIVTVGRERVTFGLALQYFPLNTAPLRWRPYAVAGVGFVQDQVNTTLAGSSSLNYGAWVPLFREGVGLWFPAFFGVRAGTEFRLVQSSQYNPVMSEDMVLRLTYAFSL